MAEKKWVAALSENSYVSQEISSQFYAQSQSF